MKALTLTETQQKAFDAIGKHRDLFINGAAGTGKSVIITEKVKADTNGNLVLCALTNKAANVLADKLDTGVNVQTIHSVLGLSPVNDGSTKVDKELTKFYFSVPAINNTRLIGKSLIVDEISMMNREIQNYIYELLEYGYLETVTFVGDSHQIPPVDGEPFDYNRVETVIELTQVERAKGELMDYYKQIRDVVYTEEPFSLYKNARRFRNLDEFVTYFNDYEGNKIVVTHTNVAADQFSKLVDCDKHYEQQLCTSLSRAIYMHKYGGDPRVIETNSDITITKIFNNYDQMCRDSIHIDYEHQLPKLPKGLQINNISYMQVLNDRDELTYISVWNGTEKEKTELLLDYFTRTYRDIQNDTKKYISPQEWKKYAKADGYLKKLSKLDSYERLPLYIQKQDGKYWHNFKAIQHALVIRSRLVSTAHRAQGITVDLAAIDLNDLDNDNVTKQLIYVALTRAAKDLVYIEKD